MTDWPLDPTPAEFAEVARLVTARLERHLGALPKASTRLPEGDLEPLRTGFADNGISVDAALDVVFEQALPPGYEPASPGYLAYIPGGGLVSSALANFIGGVTNPYTGIWAAAPGIVELELEVIRWFAKIVGFRKATAGGFLTTGGSLANFSAVVAARKLKLPTNFLKGTLYCSQQTHHCVAKAATLAGFPAENVRLVASDPDFRMSVPDLQVQLQRDRTAGWQPFMIVGNAGTTNTGAVDPLTALAEVANRWDAWFHVDAAYGGFFVLTKRGRTAMAGIERADSVALDPHKGLFLPYGTGALVVADATTLRKSHGVDADYLTDMQDATDQRVDFATITPELSRDPRGLKVWLPLKLHGTTAFADALEEKLDLTIYAQERLAALPHVRIVAAAQLSVFAWRFEPPGTTDPTLSKPPDRVAKAGVDPHDRVNKAIIEEVNSKGRVMLSGTTLNGQFVCRIAVLSFRTHRAHIDAGLADIEAAMALTSAALG